MLAGMRTHRIVGSSLGLVALLVVTPFAQAGYSCGSSAVQAVSARVSDAAKPHEGHAVGSQGRNIVETAVAAGDFKTLVTAIKAAGLADALQQPGPFTVFAPTDAVFAKLPKGTVEALLADPPKLRQVLKYHVVPGKVMAVHVVKLESARTLLGQSAPIAASGSGVKVAGANVVKTDIVATNGVIHVIDQVILPKDDIVDVAAKAGSFSTLLKAVEAANLVDTLRGEGPFTVFAPTDAAFAKLPAEALQSLLADKEQLQAVLTYHVVPGKVTAADVARLESAKTVQGQPVRIKAGDKVMVNDAQVVKTDIAAANGVIHVIDTVILPPKHEAPGNAHSAR